MLCTYNNNNKSNTSSFKNIQSTFMHDYRMHSVTKKLLFREMGCEDVNCIELVQDTVQW